MSSGSLLNFDRTMLANTDESLRYEYIRSNRMGAFSSSTLVGCNTRKYHGLLVVPLPNLSAHNHVLLSSLDASVVQHGTTFHTAVHNYEGGHIAPGGHKYIRPYSIESVPRTVYRVGGVLLQTETLLERYRNRIIVKYTLLEAHSDTKLQLRPLVAFRDVTLLTHENSNANTQFERVPDGISMQMYAEYPHLYMQCGGKASFRDEGCWYKRFEYPKEKIRGYESVEDLYSPGFFELTIRPDEPVYFTAGLEPIDIAEVPQLFAREAESRPPRTSFWDCLKHAAEQFFVREGTDKAYLLAGFPWFGIRARDTFIALPGCTLYAGNRDAFEQILATTIPEAMNFLRQNASYRQSRIEGLKAPDNGVWAIWAITEYARMIGMEDARARFGNFVDEIVQYYLSNRHPNCRLTEKGLLYLEGNGEALTWMDAEIDGKAVIPRRGYLVELNALWYHALRFYATLLPEKASAIGIDALADKAARSFCDTFINPYGYLYDYVTEEGYRELGVRPNMLFAVSLPNSPLERRKQREVLDIVTKELLTPKGIRTLSPRSEGYCPHCNGLQSERNIAYYNGSAWPWLMGAYTDAYLRIYGAHGVSFLRRIFVGLTDEIKRHGVATYSELYDGTPPYDSHGGISFAMSVGEILRALYTLEHASEGEQTAFNYLLDD